ncbi:hypothetical protein EVAR_45295_1 [Eumeta japonica]|uniref:Uncharacterized protein n=1 Tax=Eumeta variegata TaxID=151549 RepID=A0A4C1YAB8_EUMVA|nr:hypothetical protein EVAR_45295_1 [Eumeta japonica]
MHGVNSGVILALQSLYRASGACVRINTPQIITVIKKFGFSFVEYSFIHIGTTVGTAVEIEGRTESRIEVRNKAEIKDEKKVESELGTGTRIKSATRI